MSKPVCAIIGVGPLLGHSLVDTFARQGCAVAMVARNPDALTKRAEGLRSGGLDVIGIPADAGDRDSLRKAFATIRDRVGDPEILIYNAFVGLASRFITHQPLKEIRYTPKVAFATLGEL